MKIRNVFRGIARLFRGGHEAELQRFLFAEMFCKFLYPKYKFSEFGRSYLDDKDFIATYESFEGKNNYHSLDRKYSLVQLLKLLQHIPGNTVECGVFQGATSFFICRAIKDQNRKHLIFDSFEGLSKPKGEDGAYWSEGDLSCSIDNVKNRLREFSFVEYYQGWIPTRFESVADQKFSFVHLDVDLYQPTKDSLEFFYSRMSQGGIILCDDYGFSTCPGSTKALDEFFKDKKEKIVTLSSGQGFIQKL